jgi:hypothetical protein
MTRKDYKAITEAVADTLKHCSHQDIEVTAISLLVARLIPVMMQDNPFQFDENKFWNACGFVALTKK